MISATRHRFSLESGRVSRMRTLSPILQACFSSWALYFFRSVRILPYLRGGCALDLDDDRLGHLVRVTTPMRLLGIARRCSGTARCSRPWLSPYAFFSSAAAWPWSPGPALPSASDGHDPRQMRWSCPGRRSNRACPRRCGFQVEQVLAHLGCLAGQLLDAQLRSRRFLVASRASSSERRTSLCGAAALWRRGRSFLRHLLGDARIS